ncbi:MAG: inositol monophosphatase [Gammaproteobacteria bacterium]
MKKEDAKKEDAKKEDAKKEDAKYRVTQRSVKNPLETAATERASDAAAHAATDSRAAAIDRRAPREPDAQIEWIIDPLDGTANYLHGHPHYAVSIAIRRNGLLQHAVIFDPLRDELYTASRGRGAQLNDRRIRVTGQRNLARAMLATGFPFRARADLDAWLRRFRALMPRVADMRRCGSAALDLAYVAAGRLDGFWEPGLAAWDIAAGALLVREAGGFVADFQGGQDFLESGEVLAANQHLFNQLLMHIMSPPPSPARAP